MALSYKELEQKLQETEMQLAALKKSNQNEKVQQNFEELFAVFNGLEGVAHVVDMNTYEILAANKYTEKIYGENLIGSKCYKRYHKETNTPCKSCRNKKLLDNDGNILPPTVYEYINPINGRWFQCSDRAIKWPDGRLVKMEIALDIHDWKLTTEALKESEQKYLKLISKMPDVVVVHRNNKMLFLSDQIFPIIGKTPYDYRDLSVLDFMHPDDVPKVLEHSQKRQRGEPVPEKYDVRIKGANNENHIFEVRGTMIDFEGEQATLTVLTNITDKKKTEVALLENKDRLRKIIDQNPISMAIVGMDGTIEYINRMAIETFGYLPEDIPHMDQWWLLAYPDETYRLESKQAWMEKVMRGVELNIEIERGEYNITCKDGTKKNVTVFGIPVAGKIFVMFDNITNRIQYESTLKQQNIELNQAKEKIEESEILLKYVTDNIPAFVAVVDAKTLHYKFINQKFITGFNKPKDEIIGFHISKTIGHENTVFAMKYIDEVRQGRISSYINTFNVDNGTKYMHVNYAPLYNDSGEVKDIIVLTFDVTSIMQSEQQLLIAKEKAEESDRLKSAFLANMSHEIRTPLNGILGFTDILSDDDITDDKRKEFLEIINTNGKQLLAIINDIIDISKIEAGQVKITNTKCFLNQFMYEIYSFFNTEIQKKCGNKVEPILNIPSERSMLIYADDIRVRQVLHNLLGNAMKFTQKGKIEFGYTVDTENYIITFYVSDSGIGLSEEKLNLIFERFRQADETTTRNYGGTGLGLAISKGLVELMGGRIWVESQEGIGSVFYFTIPFNPIIVDESFVEPEKQRNKNSYNWAGKTILIVEDDDDSYLYLETLLDKNKATILRAENGKVAIDLCQHNKNISLILMDIQTPVMNGYEATKQIRKFNKTIPIIAQTANVFAEDRERCLSAGCNDYIMKPIDVRSLFPMIDGYLD